ncbi:hypothetical protein HY501_02600 [Candidatus Woesearchaeota archaeon]|nr:hypothetical protein [Candidatus Woesearchaeota archaeon]
MKLYSVLAVMLVVFVAGCVQYAATPEGTTTETPETPVTPESPGDNTVEMTSTGFSPATLTIDAGDTVTFTNKDTNPHWPASAVHPTHTVYPGSDISKCGTTEQESIFDACRGLEEGESWSFTFNEKGTWRYHDHLNLGLTGSIVVE